MSRRRLRFLSALLVLAVVFYLSHCFASGFSRRGLLGALLGVASSQASASQSIIQQMASESPKLRDALKSGKPVIVDFAADWCPDCQQMAPVLRELKQQVGDNVKFVTLDVSYAAPGGSTLPRNLENDFWAQRFRVDGLPHVAFIDSQRHVQTALVGDVPPNVVRADVEALMKGAELPFVMYDAFEGRSNSIE